MSKYKGIDKETILKVKDVRFPLARKDVEIDLTGLTDSFDRLRNALESHQNKVTNDTEMSIICEMAMKYLDEFKTMDDNKTEAYNKGLNDAWEFVRKLTTLVGDGGMSTQEWESIYKTKTDRIIDEYTPQEALAKLEAYEKANEIKVGDVVEGKESNTIGVVMRKNADDYCHILFRDGSVGQHEIGNFKKTGKHIDIQSLLEQIKE